MSTIRVAKRRKFTQIERETIRDARLSFRALGVLTWLLDKPDDWTTNAEQIAKTRIAGEGRDAVRTVLAELQQHGYLRLATWRSHAGKFQSEWTVFERSTPNEPERETSAGLPAPENQGGLTEADFQGLSTDTEKKTVPQPQVASLVLNHDAAPVSSFEKSEPPWVRAGLTYQEWRDTEREATA